MINSHHQDVLQLQYGCEDGEKRWSIPLTLAYDNDTCHFHQKGIKKRIWDHVTTRRYFEVWRRSWWCIFVLSSRVLLILFRLGYNPSGLRNERKAARIRYDRTGQALFFLSSLEPRRWKCPLVWASLPLSSA